MAGLLQATSLTLPVAAAKIGMELGELSEATAAAIIAAGLLSVLIFPPAALTILQAGRSLTEGPARTEPASATPGASLANRG